ncbi:uncharacterized protein LOC117111885, partial [Anneissia japonica]|uniref:uncharacterized protein LOC117111885 n=1 Tax=Anneissia japonica TaxID=1529436 RepID=UPI001425A42F
MESASETSVLSSKKSTVKKKPEAASTTTLKKTVGITANMKEAFKQKQKQQVAMLYDVPDAYEISQHVLLFSLIDRGKLNVDILVELCQLHQSTSAQLLTCIQYNDTIQDIINSASGLSNEYSILLEIIERLFEDYQKKLLPLLDNSLFARSSDVQTSHKIISMATNKCNQLLGEEKFLPKPFLELLVQMNSHCTVLLYQLTEDALALCPKLKEAFDHCREIFPDDVPRPETRAAQNKEELTKKKS